MMKIVLQDYFAGFLRKDAYINMFNEKIYSLYVTMIVGVFCISLFPAWAYLLLGLGGLGCIISGSVHQAGLQKIYYLCPLNSREREDFTNKSLWLKLFIHTGMMLITGAFMGWMIWQYDRILSLTFMGYAVCYGIALAPGYGGNTKMRVLGIIINLVSMFHIFFVCAMEKSDFAPGFKWLQWLRMGYGISLIFVVIPCLIVYFRELAKELKNVADYEVSNL